MRNFIAAIARVMAAMAQTAGRWIKRAGAWVYEMLPGGAAAAPVMPDVHHAEADTRGDEDALACVRAAAASIAAGKIPSPDITGRIDSDAFRWLMACSDDALRSVVHAGNDELRAHLQGRKSMRGVLVFDRAAISEIERGKMLKLGIDPDADYDAPYAPAMAM